MVHRMSQHVQPNGKVVKQEQRSGTLTMSAMLAVELRWHGFVESQPAWFRLAQRVLDHLIDEHGTRGTRCLPYTSNDGKTCASDLAVLCLACSPAWQKLATQYRDFALKNSTRPASISRGGAKQFNQTYSTGAQSAEALLSGHRFGAREDHR